MDAALQQLIDAVKSVAPAVWAIAIRQVYLAAYLNTAWGTLAAISSVLIIGQAKSELRKQEALNYGEDYSAFVVEAIGAIATGLCAAYWLSWAFSNFYNPQYYAILKLVDVAK
jgi:hypothetical protein